MKWWEKIFKKEPSLFNDKGASDITKKVKREHSNYQEQIRESAEDLLKSLEEESSKLKEKAKLLKEAGFVNSTIVVELEKIEKQKRDQARKVELLNKAKKTFPNHKYISSEDLDTLLKKYSMVIGNIADFRGYVPESNLLDIKNFKDSYSDYTKEYFKLDLEDSYRYGSRGYYNITKFQYDKLTEYKNTPYPSRYIKRIKSTNSIDGRKSDTVEYETIEVPLEEYNIAKKHYDQIKRQSNCLLKEENVDLLICCNELELKLTHNKAKSDPIVILKTTEFAEYGKHGYIIITSWGDDLPYDPLIYLDKEENEKEIIENTTEN